MPRTRTSRPRRPRALVLLTALIAAAALVVPTTGASAEKPAPAPPVANKIEMTVKGLVLPGGAPGAPGLLVGAAPSSTDVAFDVSVVLTDGPYSETQATELSLRVTAGASRFVNPQGVALQDQVLRTVVLAGENVAGWTGLNLAPAALGVQLTVTATARKPAADLGLDSVVFEVVKDPVTKSLGGAAFVSRSGPAVPCMATVSNPTCIDVVLPNGVTGDVFFSTGVCGPQTGCGRGSEVLQVLANLDGMDKEPLYYRETPATLIAKCDKSLCKGVGVPNTSLQVNLAPTGALTTSPACLSKGVMTGPHGHCVDYVQSKRDGSGDTYLYLLITRDARTSH